MHGIAWTMWCLLEASYLLRIQLEWTTSLYTSCRTYQGIYPHMRAKFGCGPTVVSKKGVGSTDTHIMKLLQVCQVQYCQQCVKLWW